MSDSDDDGVDYRWFAHRIAHVEWIGPDKYKNYERLRKIKIDQKKIVQHHVKGYEEFAKLVEDLETNGEQIHVLFIGGKEENGTSWCRYCVKAEPVIMEALPKASENSHFIHVEVGERSYWKDINCPFRKDPRTHLVILPTLLRWKSRQRLEGERCSNQGFVEMLFEDKD